MKNQSKIYSNEGGAPLSNKSTEVQVKFDEKGCYKLTKRSDGSILLEPITSKEAALWEAKHRF